MSDSRDRAYTVAKIMSNFLTLEICQNFNNLTSIKNKTEDKTKDLPTISKDKKAEDCPANYKL